MSQLALRARFIAAGVFLQRIELTSSETFEYSISGADHALRASIDQWMEAYLRKEPIAVEVEFEHTPFQAQVFGALSQVPFGKTVSYQELAQQAGSPKSCRAVGNALHTNRYPLLIPCHRVIRKNGKAGGYAYGLELKQALLEWERID